MKISTWLILVSIAIFTVAGCQPNATETFIPLAPPATSPIPSITPLPTVTSLPSTETHVPTFTPVPASPTPLPPTPTPRPATHSICAAGCDYTTIQAALDDPDLGDDAVIEIRDPIHTEAGIIVNQPIAIRGHGTDVTILQAHEQREAAPERILLIEEGAEAQIENISLRHGVPSNSEECGGAIMNHGILTLTRVVVRDNNANAGGGICNRGELILIDSSVSYNIANGIGPAGYTCGAGGGIKCERGTLTLVNSLVSGNQSMDADPFREVGVGGGVHIACNCSATFTNSTISGNRSVKLGGGIFVHGNLTLVNCTITDNITKGDAGGVYISGHLDFTNTIIADNSGKGGSCIVGGPGGYKGEGSIGENSNNLVRGGNCSPAFSENPLLGPLDDNGGATMTHALLPGSPAIDAIPASSCTLPTDQRGAPRPVIVDSAETSCDIGAFEVQAE